MVLLAMQHIPAVDSPVQNLVSSQNYKADHLADHLQIGTRFAGASVLSHRLPSTERNKKYESWAHISKYVVAQ